MIRPSMFFTLVATLALTLSSGVAGAEIPLNPVEIKEWKVPYGGRPRDPFAAASDEVWFVGQAGNYLGRLTPSSGTFSKVALSGHPGPHNLIVGSDGIVWYAGNLEGYIGRYDPKADAVERIPMPDPAVSDPHTLVFDADARRIWFTAQWSDAIGRLDVETRKVDIVFTTTRNSRPYGIKIGPDGASWSVLVGTNKIARVDPETLEITEFEIPDKAARPRRLEVTADGRIWYADYKRGRLGLFDPASKSFRDWLLPAGEGARPYGMARDDKGRVWVVETGVSPNRLVGFDTTVEKIISVTPIPSGAGSVRHIHYFAPDDTVWFGTDAGTVGRFATGAM